MYLEKLLQENVTGKKTIYEVEKELKDYYKVKEKNNELIHNLEIDFIVNVDKSKVNVRLSEEHSDYEWVTKDSDYLDDFIKDKLSNL